MNATSAAVGPEVDEFALAGLTPEASLEWVRRGSRRAWCPSSAGSAASRS